MFIVSEIIEGKSRLVLSFKLKKNLYATIHATL